MIADKEPRKDILHHKHLLHEELLVGAIDLEEAMIISYIQLMFPLNFLIRRYFMKKTGREMFGINPSEIIEMALFLLIVLWINDWNRF